MKNEICWYLIRENGGEASQSVAFLASVDEIKVRVYPGTLVAC